MKAGVVIQARTGSSRLPEKILLPFDGKRRIIDILVENLQKELEGLDIILATTVNPNDSVLETEAFSMGIKCFRGPEEDVLARFVEAAEAFKLDVVVRVCSDNPFLRADYIKDLLDAFYSAPADYISFGFPDGLPVIKSHLGLFCEVTTLDALKKVSSCTSEKLYHEHVTNYMYANPDKFSVRLLPLPTCLQERKDLRFTLDTPSDFDLLRKLYEEFQLKEDKSIEQLVNLVDSCEMYRNVMFENIQHNQK